MTTTLDAPPEKATMTTRRQPKVIVSLTLAAVPSAVRCARMFTAITLKEWGLPDLIETAELLVSELATNAVKSTGVLEESPRWSALKNLALIYVRLVLLEDGVIIEVVDRDRRPPVIRYPSVGAESGRGMLLVETLSKQWDFYFPPTGGKVVWCELEPPPPIVNGLPKRARSKTAGTNSPPAAPLDAELLRRVRDGLRRL